MLEHPQLLECVKNNITACVTPIRTAFATKRLCSSHNHNYHLRLPNATHFEFIKSSSYPPPLTTYLSLIHI